MQSVDPVSYTHLDVYKRQVQDRIQIAFGGAYGIEVASQIGCYTKIIVRIPMTHRGEAE